VGREEKEEGKKGTGEGKREWDRPPTSFGLKDALASLHADAVVSRSQKVDTDGQTDNRTTQYITARHRGKTLKAGKSVTHGTD